MASKEISSSQVEHIHHGDRSTNTNHNMADVPLYAESRITRLEAIRKIVDMIARSNMKPRAVQHTLTLMKKLLPSDNTIPSTVDELFRVVISSSAAQPEEPLKQYLIKHKRYQSLVASFTDTCNEASPIVITVDNSSSAMSDVFVRFNNGDSSPLLSSSSSNLNDENEHSAYERLRQCLLPIMAIVQNFDLQYSSPLLLTTEDNIVLASNQQIMSSGERDVFGTTRTFNDSDQETTCPGKKSCCFELNGCDLLNGSKQC